MELLLTSPDSKSISEQNHEADSFETSGLLNSNYQSIVKLTHSSSSVNSLFRLKQGIKIHGFQFATSTEVLLKLAIFTAVILFIFN